MIHKTGEKPGKGEYYCTSCGQNVTLDQTSDKLPPCPKCSNTSFKKG
ncbi:zinc ribbon-containing protein [Enterococcus italicus]